MKRISPFDIPLLANEISQYLSRKDLVRCVRVSKEWAAWFTPVLWRDLDCWKALPYVDTLTRQRGHIRAVRNIDMKRIGPILEPLSCTSLQRLDFMKYEYYLDTHRDQLQVLQALERISTLQHLQITLSLDRDDVCQQWIRVLEALPHLESLSLRSEKLVDGKVIQEILRLCIGYERLAFFIADEETYAKGGSGRAYQDTRAAIERMPEMQLRELSFNSRCGYYETNIFQPLLDRCPRMEKLTMWTYHMPTSQQLFKALKQTRFPQLRHLAVRTCVNQSYLAEILSYDESGLERFEADTKLDEPVAHLLIQYHHRSLRTMHFGHPGISLSALAELMAELPNLQSLEAKILPLYGSYVDDLPLDKHWACAELRSLRLRLDTQIFHGEVGSPEWNGSIDKRGLDYVFSETAKMNSLRDLRIGCDQRDLYLKRHGYLTQLGGLRQLRFFDLASTPPEEFGKSEALWMADNWPRLVQVCRHGASEIFSRTLLKKRPTVEIVYWE
ncbi:MAG: hypothetical protein J3Q66DRAFT_437549 [Benniella sp.]|nr:MAG: hypothetical protein J3Q66DRAFT_437549 [Benniella sp.]